MASSSHSMATPDTTGRSGRLARFFRDILSGKRTVDNSADAKLFFESALGQESAGVCVESIIASRQGLAAVKASVRADLSLAALQSQTLPFVQYLSRPAVKVMGEGQLLWKILLAIVDPPTVWNALVNHHDELGEQCLYPLAWLAHELLSGPDDEVPEFVVDDVNTFIKKGRLLRAESHDVRRLAYRIEKVLSPQLSSGQRAASFSPGGRHDNDHTNFRDIAIYPTTDEFLSTEKPFIRPVQAVFDADPDARADLHLDNQFRLLREDMLPEIRHDLQVALGKKARTRRTAQVLSGLLLEGIEAGDEKFGKKCALSVTCRNGLDELKQYESRKDGLVERRKFLLDNKNYLRHQSFGALLCGNEVCGFAVVDRNLDLLCKSPPVVCLQFSDSSALSKALVALQLASDSQFVLVDTPVFAYEPVLNGLKAIHELPHQDILLNPSQTREHNAIALSPELETLVLKYQSRRDEALSISIHGKVIRLDRSQIDSFVNAISAPVSLIQGPPGTGKSFVGSWIAKALHEKSTMRVLVISYTNHALDQFLEDLLNVSIPSCDIVRLGSKYTPRTYDMLLRNAEKLPIAKVSWAAIDSLKSERDEVFQELQLEFSRFKSFKVSFDSLIEYLEFSHEDRVFYQAFRIPAGESGWSQVGKKGRNDSKDYLYLRWSSGKSPGTFAKLVPKECEMVWNMPPAARTAKSRTWEHNMRREGIENLQQLATRLDSLQVRLQDLFNERDANVLKSKRIIGCTTTAAAMYGKSIRAAQPDVVLVEEAGEILEAHVLTALTPSVKQVILIGDHQQLRPKVNNYALTVERKDGYDLNMSMFERLIVQGYPHTTLEKQHRMHPSISLFARALTYPHLIDGPKTSERPAIEGLQDRVIFVNHEHPETQNAAIADKRDPTAKASKQNQFEASMVLKLVRYLAQQGYGTDKMVVLTPYLGQLRLLREMLRVENDPILNDMDSHDLLQAGLLSQAASKVKKTPIRLSTIDNYQGEESDIVIASLTRGNEEGDIGFMSAPERLNVLITRARNCMIMIGNMDTFMNSKKGKDCWVPFFQLLKEQGNLYDGIPIKCEQHPANVAIVCNPSDFDKFCPDGGCSQPCGVQLPCGVHNCQRRCHRLTDHSKVKCTELVEKTCDRQHKRRVECSKKNHRCDKCVQDDKEQERRIKRDLKLEEDRLAKKAAYAKELQDIQDEIDHQQRTMKYMTEEEDQKTTLAQQRKDLEGLKSAAVRMQEMKKAEKRKAERQKAEESAKKEAGAGESGSSQSGNDGGINRADYTSSSARDEWEDLKRLEGARNEPLDDLMGMIGLEEVKASFLEIKSTVDTKNIDFSKDRLGCCMLGNPGTGKTTVARLYARFLTSLSVIPGTRFEETTGAKLAALGVSGCQKLVEDILNDGGGVVFIDEAYQLTSGNSHGGGAVHDYLLPEVENLTGKIVFVLAGYNKQMESFFAHNPGLPSRFPVEMKFADYTDDELLKILELKLRKAASGLHCEGGTTGLFCRIVARRVGRGRGREGFGNARTVENVVGRIAKRQANRLRRERRAQLQPDDFLLTKEDLIGPKPSEALARSKGWEKLTKLIGLTEVKQAVQALVDSAQENYEREISEQPLVEYSLNKVFLGNPGTGKTTVAKLYGEILVDLGFLSKGEVVVKNPSDFVGSVVGGSEQQTKGILAAASGKVLVIDEAYGLYTNGNNGGNDPYKTAVIDTIVAEVQSVPGDDRCVLLLGYKEQLETMFQNVNPGLSRRFPLQSAFKFEDFDDKQLEQILDLKLKQQGFSVTGEAKAVALEMLNRARNRPNFGNAGEIDILLDATKVRHQKRLTLGHTTAIQVLDARDFDEDFDRAQNSETNVQKLFEGTVGSEDVVALLEGYQETVRTFKALDMDPKENIPFNFLFKGPPGTGKTTTARKMGKVFCDMGFLATAEVEECSASDMVGQYIGQTGPKVRALLDKALGRVLFIDEAYRLAEGHFAQEAIDELVDSVTKERYFKKLVIVLAGYEKDINRLTSVNEGLSSRFPETVPFRSLGPEECITLLTAQLANQKTELEKKKVSLDLGALESPNMTYTQTVAKLFADLAQQASWANARDVKTLAMAIFRRTLKSKKELAARHFVVKQEVIIEEMMSLLQEREARGSTVMPLTAAQNLPLAPMEQTQDRPSTSFSTKTTTTATEAAPPEDEPETQVAPATPPVTSKSKKQGLDDTLRDAGVSDEVWEQLQQDKRAEQEREEDYQRLLEERKRASEAERDQIVKRLVEEERRRKEEEAMRLKLKQTGVCPAGFDWIKQASGYRCAGGSHYMSDDKVRGLDGGSAGDEWCVL